MRPGGPRAPTRRASAPTLLLVLTVALAGCSGPAAPPDLPHIHGLALDPHDPSVLYVATHHGLFRAVDDAGWARISLVEWDFMGFSVHPTDPGRMYASGHPEQPTANWHNLGLVRSTDGGVTWETVALHNEVDFHAMTVAPSPPHTIWGWYDGQLYASHDGGTQWNTTPPSGLPSLIAALAASADDPDVLWAGTARGVWRSDDAGATWGPAGPEGPDLPALLVASTPADPDVLWAVFGFHDVARSTDAGRTWHFTEPVALPRGDALGGLAVHPRDATIAYVGSAEGSVHRTTDAGATWTVVKSTARMA